MPMRLSVGLAQKVGEPNFSSRGASVNLELELDAGLVAEPAKLHEKIRHLFALVRSSLAAELHGHSSAVGNGTPQAAATVTPTSSTPATGNDRSPQKPSVPRPATPAQVKAIFGIARRKGVDLEALLYDRCQVQRPDDLAVRQASSLIDELRSMGDAGEG